MKADYIHKTWHRNLLEKRLHQNRHLISRKILDVGSKNRRYDRFFKGIITAVDAVPNPGCNIVYADLEKTLPFPDAFFDSALCLEVFEYLENYQNAIAEIHRVMRPGGYAVISIPFMYHAHTDKLRYTEEFITAQFQHQGFAKVECHKIGNGYTAVWDIMRKKIMSLTSQPLRLALLLLASPYLIISRLLKLDQLTDQYYSGLFLVIKR
ncbi:MAG: methyltransferase domain-containing protein [bacterium]